MRCTGRPHQALSREGQGAPPLEAKGGRRDGIIKDRLTCAPGREGAAQSPTGRGGGPSAGRGPFLKLDHGRHPCPALGLCPRGPVHWAEMACPYPFHFSLESGNPLPGGWGFPNVLVVKNPPANAGEIRDVGFIPGLERFPGGGHGNPLQYSCLENPLDRGAWWATVHGVMESDTTEGLSTACHCLGGEGGAV